MYRGERCAQCNLRLTETDVAAYDAVHGLMRTQIGENVVNRSRLVFRRFEREAAFKRPVVGFRPAKPVPLARRSPRVDVKQFRRDIASPARGAPGASVPLAGGRLPGV